MTILEPLDGRQLLLEVFDPASVPVTLIVGRFTNNIIFSGTDTPTIAFQEQTNQRLEPALFHHNALWSLAGQSVGYRDDQAGTVMDPAMLSVTGTYAGNFFDDCGVSWGVLPPLVLTAGTMCHDGGTTQDAPLADYEGDSRPNGTAPDIGPDEI